MPPFSASDSVEDQMGVRVEYTTPDQLVKYVQAHHASNGLTLVAGRYAEVQVFTNLQTTYGKKTAGRIVKWAFWHHKGMRKGEPIGFFDFAKGSKWWTDQLHLEMQDHVKKQASRPAQATSGVRRLDF